MNFSNTTVEIVWYLTIGFFFVSIVSLFVFFILKWIASQKFEVVKRNVKYYQSIQFFRKELPKNNKKKFSYIYELGRRMVLTDNSLERKQIEQYIEEKKIIPIIEKKYDRAILKLKKLYYLSLLVVLSRTRPEPRFDKILSDKNISIEYITLALYGKAIRCKTSNDLFDIYKHLKNIYMNKYVDRRFVQFYFAIAIKDISHNEIIEFLDKAIDDLIHIPTIIAFIYALSQTTNHKSLQNTFIKIQRYYKQNVELTVAIMRLLVSWNVKSNSLILDNYESDNYIVRLTCAKFGFDLLHKTKYYKLVCYLYDPNSFVRNNFNQALHKYKFTTKEIFQMLTEKYDEYDHLRYYMMSCMEHK